MRRLPLLPTIGAVIAAAVVLSSVGTAAAQPKPEAVVSAVMKYTALGQHGRTYALLHPGQKRLVPRERFVERLNDNSPLFDLVGLKVLDKYPDPLRVKGVPQRTSTAITFRITVRGSSGRSESATLTRHVVWTGTLADLGRERAVERDAGRNIGVAREPVLGGHPSVLERIGENHGCTSPRDE